MNWDGVPQRRSSALSRPFRQIAAHQYPLEGTERPLSVRHWPILALGAPQPRAQRAERAFLCGCLAERRADVATRFARGNDGEEIPGQARNEGESTPE